MVIHKFSSILFLFSLTILSACSSQKLVTGGSPSSPVSEPTLAVTNILESQSTVDILTTQTPVPPPSTPLPVVILSPTPLQAVASQDITPQPTPSCTNRAELDKVINIFDNTALEAGQPFAKIWRIKNTGTCVWTTEYKLAFYSGEQMGGSTSIPFPSSVQPGATVDLRVDLVAPLNQTTFTGNWAFQDASENFFGVGEKGDQSISVTILVKPTPWPTTGCSHCGSNNKP